MVLKLPIVRNGRQATAGYKPEVMEALYIYDSVIMSENNQQDMEKLFYKLIGEELIRKNDLPRSLYFSGKYRIFYNL